MNILSLMVPFALVMGALFVAGFIWMVRLDQYEDLDTPAVRILFEPDSKTDVKENGK